MRKAHDVDRAKMLQIIGASAVGSPFVKYKTGPLLADDYTSTFSTRLMRKDLDLILEAAAAGGVPRAGYRERAAIAAGVCVDGAGRPRLHVTTHPAQT